MTNWGLWQGFNALQCGFHHGSTHFFSCFGGDAGAAQRTIMATQPGSTHHKPRIRKVFGNIHEVVQMPNLIEVQRESYEQFLRSDPSIGYVSGLEKTLRSVFPIRDFAGTAELDFVHYELEDPKYDTEECRQRGITYAAPMRVTLRLIVFEVDSETETRSVLDIKEQDVYMGDMPLMTGNGTFVINGTERVIVSQISVRGAGDSVSRIVARFRI
jgi:DNA-directed RNA polymerase subunit beta